MKTKTATILSSAIILIEIIVSIIAYPNLPQNMATHWDIDGNVNGYMSKDASLIFLPAISVGIMLLLFFIPRIDPKPANISKFRNHFNIFILGITVFFFYVNMIVLSANLKYSFDMNRFLMPALGALLFLVGDLIGVAEPNYTIGIRTPWTLANDTVWRDTHKVGGKVFKILSIVGIIGVFFPGIGFEIFLVTIIGAALGIVIYSYVRFRQVVHSA